MKRIYPKLRRKWISVAFILIFLWGCTQDPINPDNSEIDYSHLRVTGDVPLEWYKLFLKIERFTPGVRVTNSAWILARISLSAYEAVIPGYSDHYGSIARQIPGLVISAHYPQYEYDWEIVANSAFETAFRLYFKTAPAQYQARMDNLAQNLYDKLNPGTDALVRFRSKAYGKQVAETVYNWSSADKEGHEAYYTNYDPTYIPPGGKGKWTPTFPDYQPAMHPHWGNAQTFIATKNDRAKNPLPYSEDPRSELYKQALETRNMVNEIKNGKHAEDHLIADFWSDDCPTLTFSPSGRWVSITNQLFYHNPQPLDLVLALYTKLGIALNDAGIRCWGEKYRFNYLRPVDYIRQNIQSDWNTLMCPDGTGRYFTPEFSTYPSGHATFGAAAAEVLSQNMGYNYEMMDNSHKGRTEFKGMPRRFKSFYAMAEENAYSRIPIGVHFRMDSEAGLELGYKIGWKVCNEIKWMKNYN